MVWRLKEQRKKIKREREEVAATANH
jgi:hypothetical protein